jgi:hypothetical protein
VGAAGDLCGRSPRGIPITALIGGKEDGACRARRLQVQSNGESYVPMAKVDERNSPSPEGGVIHGFALLRFAGAKIGVSYIDEFGNEFFTEQFIR